MKSNLYKKIFALLTFSVMTALFVACDQYDDDDSPFVGPETPSNGPEEPKESTVLIYAVATNSLKANLVYDKREILEAASKINLHRNNVLIYETAYKLIENENGSYSFTDEVEVSLIKLVKKGADYTWETVKEYPIEGTASLNPARFKEVVDYVVEEYPADTYNMMFWSHSTGSQPFLAGRSIDEPTPDPNDSLTAYSFGQDLSTPEKEFEQINMDELANALPDNLFKFIWFDSCYMSNIESIYQLRNKCDYYVGYATEVCDDGMPYQKVLPFLVGSTPDVLGGAKTFFNYYDTEYYYRIATIAVTDMSKIQVLADYCKEFYSEKTLTNLSSLHKYTRYSTGPFYDLGDYTKGMAAMKGEEITDEAWASLLDECLIYKAATPYDFSGRLINPEKYSGISTHVYNFESNSDAEKYYRSLDWFKTVFTSTEKDI